MPERERGLRNNRVYEKSKIKAVQHYFDEIKKCDELPDELLWVIAMTAVELTDPMEVIFNFY
jgi:hypothetical protein